MQNTGSLLIPESQENQIRNYYRFHAYIYSATRWAFLFGRKSVIDRLRIPWLSKLHLTEVGCGTGSNIQYLAQQYVNIKLTGLDISPEMLQVAARTTQKYSRRVQLFNESYSPDAPALMPRQDVVLFSYVLTMMNPNWEETLEKCWNELPIGGRIAVVDFHYSRHKWFRNWMQFNHVEMEKHILPVLEKKFKPKFQQVKPAYGGLWEYFIFIGEKR